MPKFLIFSKMELIWFMDFLIFSNYFQKNFDLPSFGFLFFLPHNLEPFWLISKFAMCLIQFADTDHTFGFAEEVQVPKNYKN